jgi:carnitine O-acetyltransferase
LIRFIYDESARLPQAIKRSGPSSATRARKLEFHLDDRMRRIISIAAEDFRHAIESTAATVLDFQDFGKERIKSFRISPDAFVQLALQVAMVKCFGRCKSVYESASTRRYQNGRTETLRSVSAESHQFITDMLSPACDAQTRSDSLRKAAARHVARMKECMAGKGVERHLFGLLSIYERFGKELGISAETDIFGDVGWRTLCHNTLSTTSNPDPHGVVLSGFGPAVEEGFGICYTTTGSGITITLTSRSENKDAMGQFGEEVETALRDMSALLQSTM